MTNEYSRVADELLERVARRSGGDKAAAKPPPAPTNSCTTIRVVINRAQHCTFVLGGTTEAGPEQPDGANPTR